MKKEGGNMSKASKNNIDKPSPSRGGDGSEKEKN